MVKVMLVVGHGKKYNGVFDPGAVNPITGWNEQTAGDEVVGEVEKVLEAAGVDLLSEARTDDGNWAVSANQANAWGADYTIAWHHDWYKGIDAGHGFWYPGSSKGEALCKAIMHRHQDDIGPVRWDWVKQRNLGLLSNTNMPAVLIECGRIGNWRQDSKQELHEIGRAHGAAILDWLGINRNEQGEADMSWINQWPRWFRTAAKRLENKGIVSKDTNPNKKVGDVDWGEYIIMMNRLHEAHKD